MEKPFLVSVHSIAGLMAAVFILLLSLSGTILIFKDNIDDLQKPAVAAAAKPYISTDSAYAIIKATYPTAEISNCLLPEKTAPYSFFIYDSAFNNGAAVQEVFIHPYTGKILASRGGSSDAGHNFMSWLAKFHNSFHAGKKGEWLLGVIAILFVLSLISGIIIYRKNVAAVLLFKQSAYTRKNLHQLIGVYALLFNLLMAVTGFWMQRYVFKKEFYAADTWVKQPKPSPPLSFNIDTSLVNAKKLHPNFRPYVIYFAQSANGKTAVYGSNSTNGFIHSKKFADVIALDSSGVIAKTRFINENTAADYYDIVNSQLHMGSYGGWFVKLLYGLFGITGAVLSITGFLLWLKRKKRNSN